MHFDTSRCCACFYQHSPSCLLPPSVHSVLLSVPVRAQTRCGAGWIREPLMDEGRLCVIKRILCALDCCEDVWEDDGRGKRSTACTLPRMDTLSCCLRVTAAERVKPLSPVYFTTEAHLPPVKYLPNGRDLQQAHREDNKGCVSMSKANTQHLASPIIPPTGAPAPLLHYVHAHKHTEQRGHKPTHIQFGLPWHGRSAPLDGGTYYTAE